MFRSLPLARAIRVAVSAVPLACLVPAAAAQERPASDVPAQAAPDARPPSPAAAADPNVAPDASDAAAQQLDTVFVTARKREERGQDVPQSLNVFSGVALESSGVASLEQLQYRIPGVAVVSGVGNLIAIRGVSNNASQRGGGPSTAVHLDGVYLPRPAFALGEVFDLDRVEVLKGPEGTLYGRNATSGVINYVTRDPDGYTGVDGFVGVGSNRLRRAQVGADFGIGETGGVRITAATAKDAGYTRNLHPAGGDVDARDFQALRVKGVLPLSERVEARVTAQYVDDQGTLGYGISGNPDTPNFVNSLDPPQRQDPRRISLDTPPRVRHRGLLLSTAVTADLDNGMEFKSITGHVRYRDSRAYDADGSGGYIENSYNADRSDYWSQEFQLSGSAGDRLTWTSGLYFSQERTSGDSLVTDSMDYPYDLSSFIYYSARFAAESRSQAVFGEATYALSDRWSVVAGARFTRERIHGTASGEDIDFDTFEMIPFAGGGSTTSSRFTPKAVLQYRPGPQHMLYASVTSGFKSGGINFNPPVKTYLPEKITAYEVGSKSQWLDGSLELDLAAFRYDYTNLQLRTVVGNQAPISNVAEAPVQGLELALVARPVRGLTFDFNAAYVDSELKDYLSPATGTDLSGMPLPLAPRFSGTAGAQYRFALGDGAALTARAEVSRQGSVIFPALQDPDFERRDAVTLVNAHLRYTFRDKRTYLLLIGRNLTDRTYLANRNYFAGFADVETYAAPRTVEVRLGTDF